MIEFNIPKLPLENDDEYCNRISQMRESEQLTWQDIADICNKTLYMSHSESYYRKKYGPNKPKYIMNPNAGSLWDTSAMATGRSEFEELSIEEQRDFYEDSNRILQNIHKERLRMMEERSYNNQVLRRLSREETIKDIASEVAIEIGKTKPLLSNPKVGSEDDVRIYDKEGILCISDWHFGIMIDNIWNKFDPDIAVERIQKLLQKTIEKCKYHNIRKLHVANLGDMIAGRIHAQIRIQSRYDVMTQVLKITEILGEFLSALASHLDEVEYYNCWDNHSRIEPNKKESLDLETLARIIPWYLKERMADYPNVHIHDNEFGMSIITFDCMGHKIAGVHGDKDKPNKVVENITLYTQRKFDMILTAHLHHFSCDENNTDLVVSNGSLMGTDDNAEGLRKNSKPSQNLIVVAKDNVADDINRLILE